LDRSRNNTDTANVSAHFCAVRRFLAENISGHALATALDRALKEPATIAAMGENARQTVIKKFSELSMVEAHLSLYRSLMENRTS
jgi:glycosyltransferase involved in cell wall biosynthesis